MYTLEAHLLIGQMYLDRMLEFPLVSYPHFLLESILILIAIGIYIYLSLEVRQAKREEKYYMCPHSIQFKQSMKQIDGGFSRTSVKTSIVHCDYFNRRGRQRRTLSKMSWLTENRDEYAELFSGDFQLSEDRARRHHFVDKLTALTPAQFVRLDKEEQMRNLQTIGCMRSLTTLFNNVVNKRYAEPQLREQIDAAKEDCECSAVSHQLMQYLDSERVTDSLIDVLNHIIEDTNAENPLPMNGDLTALVYDIGNIQEHATTLFERAYDIPETSASSTTASEAVSKLS